MIIVKSLFYPYDRTIEANPFIYYDDDDMNYPGYTRFNNMIYIVGGPYSEISDCYDEIRYKAKLFEKEYNIELFGIGNHKYVPLTTILSNKPLDYIDVEKAKEVFAETPYSYRVKQYFTFGKPINYDDKDLYEYTYVGTHMIYNKPWDLEFIPIKTYYLNKVYNIKTAYCYYHPYYNSYIKRIEYISDSPIYSNTITDFHLSCIYKCLQ